ncbi:MAG: hypothetical protein ACK47R_02180, partial [Planctomycetia bacterium]
MIVLNGLLLVMGPEPTTNIFVWELILIVWLVEVRVLDAKVRVYSVPAVPLIPTLVKVAMPFTALT